MTDAALCTSFNAATNRIAAGSFDGRVIVWNVPGAMPVSNFLAAPGYKAP
jgi:hypothetical protein